MPISYTLDRARRRIHTTVTGSVTVDDILQHFEAACREQILDYAELIDARDAAPPFLSAADIRRAAAIDAPNLKCRDQRRTRARHSRLDFSRVLALRIGKGIAAELGELNRRRRRGRGRC